jgi:hypothetical protein
MGRSTMSVTRIEPETSADHEVIDTVRFASCYQQDRGSVLIAG